MVHGISLLQHCQIEYTRAEVFCFCLPWHSSLVLSPLSSDASFRKCVEIQYLRSFYSSSRFEWNAVQKLLWRDRQMDLWADNWIKLSFFFSETRLKIEISRLTGIQGRKMGSWQWRRCTNCGINIFYLCAGNIWHFNLSLTLMNLSQYILLKQGNGIPLLFLLGKPGTRRSAVSFTSSLLNRFRIK